MGVKESKLEVPPPVEASPPPSSSEGSYDYYIKYLLIGDSGVGKSCLLTRFTEFTFSPSFFRTIGMDFKIKTIPIGDSIIKLQIWDSAGQERYRSLATSYYPFVRGIILVYDVTDRASFENCANWIKNIQLQAREDVVVCLVGNKDDLTEKKVISTEEGKEMASKHGYHFMEVSAMSSENVNEMFLSVARVITEKLSASQEYLNEGVKEVKEASFSCHVRTTDRKWIRAECCAVTLNAQGMTITLIEGKFFNFLATKKSYNYSYDSFRLCEDSANSRQFILQYKTDKQFQYIILLEQPTAVQQFRETVKAFNPEWLITKGQVFESEEDFRNTYETHCAVLGEKPMDFTIAENSLDVHQSFTQNHCLALAESLRWCGVITTLDISNTNLRFSGIQALCSALMMNKVLQELYCKNNRIGKKGGAVLGGWLANNSSLRILHISGNNLKTGGMYIAAALIANSTLTNLEMDNNSLGDEVAIKLASSMDNNDQCKLTSISMKQNDVTEKGWRVLTIAIEKSSTLLEFSFDEESASPQIVSRIKTACEQRKNSKNSAADGINANSNSTISKGRNRLLSVASIPRSQVREALLQLPSKTKNATLRGVDSGSGCAVDAPIAHDT